MKMICPMITAFREDGLLDTQANIAHIERVIAGGVDRILTMGSIGEFYAMTLEERMALAALVVKTVNGRVPVWVGVGDTTLANVKTLMAHNGAIGADAVVALPPYYMVADQACLFHFYAELAAYTPLPLYLYNFPDRTGISLAPETLVRLAEAYPQIVGIKDTVDNISHTRALIQAVQPIRKDFEIYSGFDEYALPNLMAGGSGAICGLNNLIPATFQQLLSGFITQHWQSIKEAQTVINQLMPLYTYSTPFVQAIKVAASLQTPLIKPIMRHPSTALDPQACEAIAALCRNLPV